MNEPTLLKQALVRSFPNMRESYYLAWDRENAETFERFRSEVDRGSIDLLGSYPDVGSLVDSLRLCLIVEHDNQTAMAVLLDPAEYLLNPSVIYWHRGVHVPCDDIERVRQYADAVQ